MVVRALGFRRDCAAGPPLSSCARRPRDERRSLSPQGCRTRAGARSAVDGPASQLLIGSRTLEPRDLDAVDACGGTVVSCREPTAWRPTTGRATATNTPDWSRGRDACVGDRPHVRRRRRAGSRHYVGLVARSGSAVLGRRGDNQGRRRVRRPSGGVAGIRRCCPVPRHDPGRRTSGCPGHGRSAMAIALVRNCHDRRDSGSTSQHLCRQRYTGGGNVLLQVL